MRETSPLIMGSKSHPPHQSSSPVPQSIISLMGATGTKRIAIYENDSIFEKALIRLRSTKDLAEEDRSRVKELVDHLLANSVSKRAR